MDKRSVRWGDKTIIDVPAGAGLVDPRNQFVDYDEPARIVRVRMQAEFAGGTGNCAGCNVFVTVIAGVGSSRITRVFVLTPTNTTPFETEFDTPAATVQVGATIDPAASAPPYKIRVSAIIAPWTRILEEER